MPTTTERRLDASDWSGTEQRTTEFEYEKQQRFPSPAIRIVNDLDVEVTVDVRLSDSLDSDRNRLEDVSFFTDSKVIGWPAHAGTPGSQGTVDTITLSAGEYVTYSIPAVWDVLHYMVTPTTAPSGGTFRLIDMT